MPSLHVVFFSAAILSGILAVAAQFVVQQESRTLKLFKPDWTNWRIMSVLWRKNPATIVSAKLLSSALVQ
jgi:hypothetical protein